MPLVDEVSRAGLLAPSDAERFVRHGHFTYESGDHGDTWLALELLFADPARLRRAAARLVEKLRPHEPDLVCGPLVGGALVGQWVAHELGVPFVFAVPRPRSAPATPSYDVPSELRQLLVKRRAAVVDDAINAGAATLACVREIEARGGTAVAAGALLVRSPGVADGWAERGLPAEFLVGVGWNTFPAADCPLCRAGVPLAPPP